MIALVFHLDRGGGVVASRWRQACRLEVRRSRHEGSKAKNIYTHSRVDIDIDIDIRNKS